MIETVNSVSNIETDEEIEISVDCNGQVVYNLDDAGQAEKTIEDGPRMGEVDILSNGRVKYEPVKDIKGSDVFIIGIKDGDERKLKKVKVNIIGKERKLEDKKESPERPEKSELVDNAKEEKKKIEEAKKDLDESIIKELKNRKKIKQERIEIYKQYSDIININFSGSQGDLIVKDEEGKEYYIQGTDKNNASIDLDGKKYVTVFDEDRRMSLFCLDNEKKILEQREMQFSLKEGVIDLGEDKLIPVSWGDNNKSKGYFSLKENEIVVGRENNISYVSCQKKRVDKYKSEIYKGLMETDQGKYVLVKTKGGDEKKYKILDLEDDFKVVDKSDNKLYYQVDDNNQVTIICDGAFELLKRKYLTGDTKIGEMKYDGI